MFLGLRLDLFGHSDHFAFMFRSYSLMRICLGAILLKLCTRRIFYINCRELLQSRLLCLVRDF